MVSPPNELPPASDTNEPQSRTALPVKIPAYVQGFISFLSWASNDLDIFQKTPPPYLRPPSFAPDRSRHRTLNSAPPRPQTDWPSSPGHILERSV